MTILLEQANIMYIINNKIKALAVKKQAWQQCHTQDC